MNKLIVFAALIGLALAAPSPQVLLQTSPLLARYASAPEAPASTVHATHVAAASAYAPLTYALPYNYDYNYAPFAYYAKQYPSLGYAVEPFESHGYKIAY